MKFVLFLLSGNAQKIADANKLNFEEIQIIKLDEKELSKPTKIVSLIKQFKGFKVYFGTIDNRFQRFQTFIKIYLLLSCSSGIIIDELGQQNKFNLTRLILQELPLLLVEVVYSIVLIIYYHIKIYLLKWKYTRN